MTEAGHIVLMALTIGVEVVLVFVFAFLRAQHGHGHMTRWAVGWAVGAVGHVAGLAVFLVPAPALQPLLGLCLLGQALLLLSGTYQREGRRLPRAWLALPVAAGAVAGVFHQLGASSAQVALPPVAVVAAALVWTGLRVLATRGTSAGATVAGLGFLAFGLHTADFPFLVDSTWFFPWGLGLAVFFEVVIGLGLVIVSLDQVRADALEGAQRQRAIIEGAVDAFFRCTADGRVVFGNAALAGLVGVPREALAGLVLEPIAQLARTAADGRIDEAEVPWAHGAQRRAVAVTARSFTERGQVLWEGFVRDVTRARLHDAEAAERAKLEALGRLAGGVAHDFNNLLTVIQGGIAEARIAAANPACAEPLDDAGNAAARAAELTRQLLDFGRQLKANGGTTNVRDVMERSARLLLRSMGAGRELSIEDDGRPALVRLSSTQLTQVLLNLVLNARDAMPGGGRVLVRIGGDEGTVTVDVVDTGTGMDAATQPRIFEPFFSTKGDRGTGLGLATVHAIVSEAGGRIEVRSAPGQGTTMHVVLPRAGGPADAPRPNGLKVLVVDDDDAACQLMKRMLASAGYQVVSASSPGAALEALRREHFDVLLTDVVMPDLEGPALASQAHLVDPALKVVFVTGHPSRAEALRDSALVLKPFSREALVAAVGRARAPS